MVETGTAIILCVVSGCVCWVLGWANAEASRLEADRRRHGVERRQRGDRW